MLSTKPYLIRAFNEWIADSECTPYIVANANHPRCNIPREHVKDGEIVFNISSEAVRDLRIGNSVLEFSASFSGVVRLISIPINAILAIYAEENDQGMFFDAEEEDIGDEDIQRDESSLTEGSANKKSVSHLRLVE